MKYNSKQKIIERDAYNNIIYQIGKASIRSNILKIKSGGLDIANEIVNDILLTVIKKSFKSKGREHDNLSFLINFPTDNRDFTEIKNFFELNFTNNIKLNDNVISSNKSLNKIKESWSNFLFNFSKIQNCDKIAEFIFNLLYGGIITDSRNGTGWINFIEIECKNESEWTGKSHYGFESSVSHNLGINTESDCNSHSNSEINIIKPSYSNIDAIFQNEKLSTSALAKLEKILSSGSKNGNFCWILKGKDLLNTKLVNILKKYSYFSFILSDSEPFYNEYNLSLISNLKNIMILLKVDNKDIRFDDHIIPFEYFTEMLKNYGILYSLINSPFFRNYENLKYPPIFNLLGPNSVVGNRSNSKSKNLSSFLLNLLFNPILPIKIENYNYLINVIEQILSNGKSKQISSFLV